MLIKGDIEKNRILKSKLHGLIAKFGYKYVVKLFGKELESHKTNNSKSKLYVDFQKTLLKIPKWSDKTIKKQYKKFIKWANRLDLEEQDLQQQLTQIIRGSTQIIINKSDVFVDTLLQNYKFPSIQNYYYRCLKRIARRIYENPKLIMEIKVDSLKNDLENILQKVLPYSEIKTILEFVDHPDNNDDVNLQVEYNFNDYESNDKSTNSNKSSIKLRGSDQVGLVIDKQSSDKSLHYISSNDLHNINDESDEILSVVKQNSMKNDNDYKDDDNVKYIRVPKFKKTPYYYNKPKINELNEYFFNE